MEDDQMIVGFDIGGTFTDLAIIDDRGQLRVHKMLSDIDCISADIGARLSEVRDGSLQNTIVHGTTLASNAVIEGKVAKTGLLTTRGFRDDLEMRRQRRPNIYDPAWTRLPPLVARDLRLEIPERVLADGTIDIPLDKSVAIDAIAKLRKSGVEAVSVCLINAYQNPIHELMIGALLDRYAPEITVCLSSEVHPEIGEYERASTTTINASLVPVIRHYLDQLETGLSSYCKRLLVMQSNGGITSSGFVRKRPVVMIESGPAAGVLAVCRIATENKWGNVLSFDMGGTTAKTCLIENGVPLERTGSEIGGGATTATQLFGSGGHIVRSPSLDIVEVGAGGGSLAWIDSGGALRVGPQSAGANPGPACYSRGGLQPTVTDANLVLGYIRSGSIGDGSINLDSEAAKKAIESVIAEPLGIDLQKAAYGIIQVANATMMRALRAVSSERGRDPRKYTLVAFGGAGPMHAVTLAQAIGVSEIRVPPFAGLLSSIGLLLADYRQDYVRSIALPLQQVNRSMIQKSFAEMETDARNALESDDLSQHEVQFERQADMRYLHQISEIPQPVVFLDKQMTSNLETNFAKIHLKNFGFVCNDPVELVNLRLRSTIRNTSTTIQALNQASRTAQSIPEMKMRRAYFGPIHGALDTKIVSRAHLESHVLGPLIVEERDTTIVVPPNWKAILDPRNNIMIQPVDYE